MSRHRLADGIAAAAVLAALALHVRFHAVDARPPADLGHYYDGLRAFVSGEGAPDTPYAALLGVKMRVVGPSAALMEAVDGAWLVVALLGLWATARRVGPWAGATAVLLAVAFPQTHVIARTHWIHHPEAAALLGTLGLGLWGRGIPAALLLFLGLTIRPTGLAFGLPVAAWLAWEGRRAAIAPILAALAGMVVQAPGLAFYLSRKAASATGYAASVQAPWAQAIAGLTAPAGALAGALAVSARGAIVAVPLAWIAVSLVAMGVFHVGADNFPLAGYGLALLAGIGAERVSWGRLGTAAAAAVALVVQGTSLLAAPKVVALAPVLGPWVWAGPLNYLRVWWEPTTVESVAPAVRRACAGPLSTPEGLCMVLAERGLFNPSWEDGGTFALWLAGLDRVAVVTPPVLWDEAGRPVSGDPRVHALVTVRCREGVAPDSGGRFERQEARFGAMVADRAADGPTAWTGDPEACTQTWYAGPKGGLAVE